MGRSEFGSGVASERRKTLGTSVRLRRKDFILSTGGNGLSAGGVGLSVGEGGGAAAAALSDGLASLGDATGATCCSEGTEGRFVGIGKSGLGAGPGAVRGGVDESKLPSMIGKPSLPLPMMTILALLD